MFSSRSPNFCNFTPRLHQKRSQKVRNQKFPGGGGGGGGGTCTLIAYWNPPFQNSRLISAVTRSISLFINPFLKQGFFQRHIPTICDCKNLLQTSGSSKWRTEWFSHRQELPRSHFRTYLNNREQNSKQKGTFACFIDFRKAFDTVNRKYLDLNLTVTSPTAKPPNLIDRQYFRLYSIWAKLEERYGISGGFLHSLKSMYREVSCSIKLNDQLTDRFLTNNGVK